MITLSVAVVSLALMLSAPPGMAADEGTRLSGSVVAIDPRASTLVIEELGPGSPGGTTASRKRTIHLTPDTAVWMLQRQNGPSEGGWMGGFRAQPISLDELRPGDFATVLLDGRDEQQVATAIEVIRDPARAAPARR
jgi:hypothetical protein